MNMNISSILEYSQALLTCLSALHGFVSTLGH